MQLLLTINQRLNKIYGFRGFYIGTQLLSSGGSWEGVCMQELPQENVPLQVSGLWACPANSGLASPHYHVSQLFKIKPSQARFGSTYTKINPSLLFASPLLTSPLEKLLYLRGLQRGLGPETPGLKKNMSEMWGPICED